jgi:hypothetical protein
MIIGLPILVVPKRIRHMQIARIYQNNTNPNKYTHVRLNIIGWPRSCEFERAECAAVAPLKQKGVGNVFFLQF